MINLKIDPEFQSQIPPLTDDEFKQLEDVYKRQLLCCLLILCERRFQRSKVLLVLVDDFENDFALGCVGHSSHKIVKLCAETGCNVFQCDIIMPHFLSLIHI